MREIRRGTTHRLHDLDLRCGVGHMIGPAHDRADVHVNVVHRRGESIQHLTIRPDQHRIRNRSRIDRDVAQDTVAPLNPLQVQQEAPVSGGLRAQTVPLGRSQPVRGAVINRWLAHVQLFLALQVKIGRALKALIEAPVGLQLFGGLAVAFQPQRLLFDAVPGQAQPFEVFHQPVGIFLLRTDLVSIIETQDKGAAGLAGDHPVHQRGAQIADMDKSRGRRGETGNGRARCHIWLS